MPGSFTHDFNDINLAEAVTNWLELGTWGASFVATPDIRLEGTNDLWGRITANYGWALASHAGLDLTINERHIFFWSRNITWPKTGTLAQGGWRICLSSDTTPTITGSAPNNGPTNSKNWAVGGSDTEIATGWVCYVIDPQGTSTFDIGSPTVSSMKRMGLGAYISGTVGGGSVKPMNINFSAIRYGTGLTINAGTEGAPVTLPDIYTYDADSTRMFGVITSANGIYFCGGKLRFGTAAQSAITYFKDTNRVIVFQNFPVATTFYELILAGAASYVTTVQLGNYSNSIASDGFTIRGVGNAIWTLSASASNTIFKAYASVFSEMKAGALNSSGVLRSCTFSNSGTLTPNGATIADCIFQNLKTTSPISATNALIINSKAEMDAVTNTQFINCNRAIRITSDAEEYSFVGLKFSGNTYDIENTSGGDVVINLDDISNPTTSISPSGGSVTFVASATLSLTGLQVDTEVRVYNHGTSTELAGEEDIDDGVFDWAYNPSTYTAVDIHIVSVDYIDIWLDNISIGAGGLTIPIQQQYDRQYFNPPP